MTNQKPIDLVLSRELVQQWRYEASNKAASITGNDGRFDYIDYIVTQAAQWGYKQRAAVNKAELQKARDEELEACCALASKRLQDGVSLRAARRPKLKSQAEEALETLRSMQIEPVILDGINVNKEVMDKYDIIRRALESLPDV